MGRPHLRVVRTPEEEAFIEQPSASDKQAAKTNHATWRFELLATVGADPLADAPCLSVVLAYTHFCKPNERAAFLSEIDLQSATSLDVRAIRKRKQILISLGYMRPIGKTASGIVIYQFDNPRKELVADHRVIFVETLKEADSFKREEERRKRRLRGSKCAPPENEMGGADMHPTRGTDVHPNSLDATLEEGGIDAEGSYTGGLGAYVRERWAVLDDGWPPLRRDEPDGEAP